LRGSDYIQFASCSAYFLEGGDNKIFIDIVRIGSCRERASAEYSTVDGSAEAGIKYIAKSGTVEFQPGEKRKEIRIDMMQDEQFDGTTNFTVLLFNPAGASIRRYLNQCEIFVCDDDLFPTNGISAWFSKDKDSPKRNVYKIPALKLIKEYMLMTTRSRTLMKGVIVVMAIDQVNNILIVWKIMVMSFLLDGVLRPAMLQASGKAVDDLAGQPPIVFITESWFPSTSDSIKDNPNNAVIFIMIMNMLPSIIRFFMARLRIAQRVRGKAIDQLQGNLVRKYLYYDDDARAKVSVADFTMAVIRDIPKLSDIMCEAFFNMIQGTGLLLILGITGFLQTSNMAPWKSIVLFLVYPLCGLTFLAFRQAGSQIRQAEEHRKETNIIEFTQTMTSCYRLIADYGQRGNVVEMFEKKVRDSNTAVTEKAFWYGVNNCVGPLLTATVVLVFILSTYAQVISGGHLGVFVTGVTIWEAIGNSFQGVYEDWQYLLSAVGPLQNISHYMNMTTDVARRAGFHDIVLGQSRDMHMQAKDAVACFEHMSIMVENVHFEYRGQKCHMSKPIFERVGFEIHQGQLVAVTGFRGSGKATLLQLLGGVLLPSQGSEIFIPPHVRLLHVTQQPQIIPDVGLFANITFGPADEEDEHIDRVIRLCQRMGVSAPVIDHIKSDAQGERAVLGGDKNDCGGADAPHESEELLLSHSDTSLVHLVRALTMNPEVLIIHKPTASFSDRHAKKIVEILRDFVDNRGLEEPRETVHSRRPRTCIFSLPFASPLTEGADLVLRVEEGGVRADEEQQMAFSHSVWDLFQALDTDRDERVTMKDFLEGMKRQMHHADLLTVEVADMQQRAEEVNELLRQVFVEYLDCTQSGWVNFDEMLRGLRRRRLANLNHDLDQHGHASSHGQIQGPKECKFQKALAQKKDSGPEWMNVDIPFEAHAPKTTTSTFGMQDCAGKAVNNLELANRWRLDHKDPKDHKDHNSIPLL